jgi:hypothetical protein
MSVWLGISCNNLGKHDKKVGPYGGKTDQIQTDGVRSAESASEIAVTLFDELKVGSLGASTRNDVALIVRKLE